MLSAMVDKSFAVNIVSINRDKIVGNVVFGKRVGDIVPGATISIGYFAGIGILHNQLFFWNAQNIDIISADHSNKLNIV